MRSEDLLQALTQLVATLADLVPLAGVQLGVGPQKPSCRAQGEQRVCDGSLRAFCLRSIPRAVKERKAQLKLGAYELCPQTQRTGDGFINLVK